jgi:hypothetical protein
MGKATNASIETIESWQEYGCFPEDGEQNRSEKRRKILSMLWNNKELINTFWP